MASVVYVASNPDQLVGQTADYTSIQEAVDNAKPGDTIMVAGGHYEPFTVNVSGTEDAPITIMAMPDTGDVIIDGKGTDVNGLIDIREQSYI